VKIKDFNSFNLQKQTSDIEMIEDCFLEFCDKYELDVDVDKGYYINNGFMSPRMLPDLIKMARQERVKLKVDHCYRIEFFPKYRRISGGLSEINYKEEINDDFKKAILRLEKLNKFKPFEIPHIRPTLWGITLFLSLPDVS